MIVDKKSKIKQPVVVVSDENIESTEEIQYTTNALCDVFNAVKKILGSLKEDESDPESPSLFKTIALNTGQLSRIKNSKQNKESALIFPAVFLHFINVRYLVQQARVGEGRATLRVQYVLNRLNNSDEEFELEGYELFQRINVALQDGKNEYPALTERFSLTYFDQPESFGDGLQPYWIDYEVYFRENSAYKFRNYVDRYLVIPPFTNHSDQLIENNTDNHDNHIEPSYDEVSGINE
ncbi:hypothetical protein [Bacteroides sp. 224]|uniref:hypothetical protein n=1 Tax=Bacteroides sp. 224 TaxID=2302936 RepID=UPI0013D34DAE|nr:hypothetical protein [Bacteroides sp. 224]NDV63955.1 hypothetical protein [Bacteroides sp. 224]